MKLPESAAELTEAPEKKAPDYDKPCIQNNTAGIEVLTPLQALDAINYLSMALLIDGNNRRRETSPTRDS